MSLNTILPEPPPIGQDSDLPWLVEKYTFTTDAQLKSAYSDVAKGLAIFEETPRGTLGPALRQRYPEPIPNLWFCTLALARTRLPKSTLCGLGELCQRFGFSRHGAHQALRDVEMCFQVLRHFHQEDPITSLDPKARKAAPTLFAA